MLRIAGCHPPCCVPNGMQLGAESSQQHVAMRSFIIQVSMRMGRLLQVHPNTMYNSTLLYSAHGPMQAARRHRRQVDRAQPWLTPRWNSNPIKLVASKTLCDAMSAPDTRPVPIPSQRPRNIAAHAKRLRTSSTIRPRVRHGREHKPSPRSTTPSGPLLGSTSPTQATRTPPETSRISTP